MGSPLIFDILGLMENIETYPVKQTADLIGKAPNTLRTWGGSDYFGPYLSSYANPEPGKDRRYTEEDIRILRTAVILQSRGLKIREIIPRIASGEILELPEEPDLPKPEEPKKRDKRRAPRAEDRSLALPELMEGFKILLRPYEAQIDRLSEEIGRERESRAEAEKELSDKLDQERERRAEAEIELSRISAKLEERDRSWFRRLFGG